MIDTVTKLMRMIDAYATDPAYKGTSGLRQALQDELVRLFTPLTDEQIDDACESLGFGALSWTVVARAVEKAHGITGEKNETA